MPLSFAQRKIITLISLRLLPPKNGQVKSTKHRICHDFSSVTKKCLTDFAESPSRFSYASSILDANAATSDGVGWRFEEVEKFF